MSSSSNQEMKRSESVTTVASSATDRPGTAAASDKHDQRPDDENKRKCQDATHQEIFRLTRQLIVRIDETAKRITDDYDHGVKSRDIAESADYAVQDLQDFSWKLRKLLRQVDPPQAKQNE